MLTPILLVRTLWTGLYLSLGEVERVCEVKSLGAHHVLLPLELRLQPLQLVRREDGADPLALAAAASAPSSIALLHYRTATAV